MCAGKKIHEALLDAGNVGVTSKYMQECQLMSDLHHPNITPAVPGCVFPPQLPTPCVADGDTRWKLGRFAGISSNIPLILKRSLLEDVAIGTALSIQA